MQLGRSGCDGGLDDDGADGDSEKRPRRTQEGKKRQLAEAAAALFSERGYPGTTIDDIAAAVDVSPRTFFRYFPTKEDLVVAIGATSLDQFFEALKDRPPQESLQV